MMTGPDMIAMLGRLLLLPALLLMLAGRADAEPNAPAAPAPTTAELAAEIARDPITFYLAKGESDACGQGCSEWIAAEGHFDADAPQRLRALLNRLGKRKLPIFFHSPGGLIRPSMAVGRLLRERGLTAGVSRTVAAGCQGVTDEACRDLKRSGQSLPAELHNLAGCNSGCVFALVGAKSRQVPPGARLGVHSGKPVGREPDARAIAASRQNVRHYLQEMQIADGLAELIFKTPFEQIRYLSRDEIAAFGIDARRFQETRWLVAGTRSPVIVKFVLEAKGASGKEFRTSMIRLRCAAEHRMFIDYVRGLASDEIGATRTIKFIMVDRDVLFGKNGTITNNDGLDRGGSFDTRLVDMPQAFIEAVAAGDSIDIVESDPTNSAAPPRSTRLSTNGLANGLEQLRKACESHFPAAPAVKYLDQPGVGLKK